MIARITAKQWPLVGIALVAAACSGYLQGLAPFLGPGAIMVMIALPILLALSTEWLVSLLIVSLICARLLLLFGAPGIVTFAHFGILLVIMLKLIFRLIEPSVDGLRMIRLVTTLGIVVLVSALFGGWHGLRPLLSWMTLAGPFVVYALISDMPEAMRDLFRRLLIGLGLLQIPFVFLQFVQYGIGDNVRGTLINQGAGAHILGFIGIICACMIWIKPGKLHVLDILMALALASLGIWSDAKQGYLTFAIASLPIILFLVRKRVAYFPIISLFVLILSWAALHLSHGFDQITTSKVEWYLDLKYSYSSIVMSHLDSASIMFGLGPGNGTSRIAQLTTPGYLNSVPTSLIGTTPASLANELYLADRLYWGKQTGSSASSPFYSFLGLFTDLGVLGTVTYLLMGVQVWRSLKYLDPLARAIGQTLILTTVILSALFMWLDEPAFMVFLAAALAVLPRSSAQSLPKEMQGHESSTSSQSISAARWRRYSLRG